MPSGPVRVDGGVRRPRAVPEDEDGGAAQDDVVGAVREAHREVGRGAGEEAGPEGLLDGVAQDAAEQVLGAAEDDLREVEGGDDGGEGDAEALAGLAQRLLRSSAGAAASAFSRWGAEIHVSRQPTLPQRHIAPPSVPTVTWPISPEAKCAPRTRWPPTMRPPRHRGRS